MIYRCIHASYKKIMLFGLMAVMAISSIPFSNVMAEDMEKFYILNDISHYDPNFNECSATNGSVTLSGKDNREKIFNYLLAQGLTAIQAAGILGNIQSESGGTFSPTINEYSESFPGGGYGIVQWTHDPGRRKNVVDYMTQKNPTLMAKYYNAAYSTEGKSYTTAAEGFVFKNAQTGELAPVADNDALLLSQLDFLMSETTVRVIRSKTVTKVPGLSVGDIEWDAVKKQTTIKGASDIWVYNFEIPGEIDTTAIARISNGQKIYDMYNGTTPASSGGCSDQKLTGDTRSKVVQLAEAELAKWSSGALKPGSGNVAYLQGNTNTDWCAYFASWIYKEAGYPMKTGTSTAPNQGSAIANVSVLNSIAKENTLFEWHPADGTYTPQPGDLALHGYHVNIVISAKSPTNYVTIGGNEGAGGNGSFTSSSVKKAEGSYWSTQAEGYVSPKG